MSFNLTSVSCNLRRSAMLLFVATSMLTVLSACSGGDGNTGPEETAVGTYLLTSVNGSTLPVTIFQTNEGRIEVTSGEMVLRSDGTYRERVGIRILLNGGPTEIDEAVENGTYSVVGTQITFNVPATVDDPAFSYTGAVSGDVLTYTNEGISLRYQR
ncbi:MAG TPA: hypothetical protein VM939_01100 [Gemmatimonadaceae bacterium]|nr:hypothetical protein [Gemmatimonadaceae bacterium]